MENSSNAVTGLYLIESIKEGKNVGNEPTIEKKTNSPVLFRGHASSFIKDRLKAYGYTMVPYLPNVGVTETLQNSRETEESATVAKLETNYHTAEAEVEELKSLAANPESLEYQPFPVDLLPEPVRSYVTANASAIGCDPVFIALPLLAALASAIGNSRRVELKRGWAEPAIIWGLVVANSGSLKSPAFDAAMLPIKKRQEKAKKKQEEAMETYESDMEVYGDIFSEWKNNGSEGSRPRQPGEPTWERCWTEDTTMEALASLLQQNPRGLLLACDELSAWFGSFDRYSKSKGGGDSARWLPLHGGRALFIDRKTGEPRTLYIPNASVSVAGGIQPGVLRNTLSRTHQDNGMAARFLYAMPPKAQKRWTEDEIDEAVNAETLTVFDKLFALRPDNNENGEMTPRLVTLSAKAKDNHLIPYVDALGREQMGLDDSLSATCSKLEGYAARLALMHYMTRCAANDPTAENPDTLDEISMAAGIALSRWFGREARRVIAMISESDDVRDNHELLGHIKNLGGAVTANALRRLKRKYPTSEKAEAALQKLAKEGYGDWKQNPIGEQGGRPTRTFYLFSNKSYPM